MVGVSGGIRAATAAAALSIAGAALPVIAQPMGQSVPGGTSQGLNAALARLARNPRDLSALIDAGNAALAMGDVDAAIGFFARADQLSPNNMRVKAGLASAMVHSENPYDAIPLFAEAEKGAGLDAMLVSDRGLAYDLVGDTAAAQRYYRAALASGASDETLRRLALSQAIAGDRAGMELTLSPLLQRQDKAAWRTRAFSLAILNRPEEAVAIANQTMPADLANGIAPYLRYMPRLTPAQQAAAANFGRFPRAADIGHDDPRVALYAPPRRAKGAGAALVPAGEPLGRGHAAAPQGSASDTRRQTPPPALTAIAAAAPGAMLTRSAPPEPMPARQITPAAPVPASTPAAVAPSASALGAVAARQTPPVAQPTAPVAANFDLARLPAPTVTAAVTPPPAVRAPEPPKPAAAPSRPRSLADAFAEFTVPKGPATPAPGAVDVRKIAAPKPKPVEPPKPAHPSRIWVQIGTGRDMKALGFTWRGLTKDNPALFKGKSASVSDWGRTNRLLTGPFATEAAADTYLAKLKKAGLDAFEWISPAGQVVDDLPGK